MVVSMYDEKTSSVIELEIEKMYKTRDGFFCTDSEDRSFMLRTEDIILIEKR